MIKNNPLVSVIIPTYNRAKYLERAITSAQNQIYKNIEIIVIDDGSTDNTAEIIKQYNNVQYYYKENGRQASARNAGLKIAKGEFICTLDSDDYWHPNFLSESIDQLLKHNLDFVFANSFKESEITNTEPPKGVLNDFKDLKIYFQSEKYLNQPWILLEYEEIRKIYLDTCPAPSSALVLKKNAIVGDWEESILVADDWEFVIRILLSKKCKTAFCKEPLWTKHIIGDNVYESLNHDQSVKYIIVHDFKIILNNNYPNLRSYEIDKLNQHRVNVCFASIYRNIVIKRKIKECFIFFLLSFNCSPLKTINKIVRIRYCYYLGKIIKKIVRKIKRR